MEGLPKSWDCTCDDALCADHLHKLRFSSLSAEVKKTILRLMAASCVPLITSIKTLREYLMPGGTLFSFFQNDPPTMISMFFRISHLFLNYGPHIQSYFSFFCLLDPNHNHLVFSNAIGKSAQNLFSNFGNMKIKL